MVKQANGDGSKARSVKRSAVTGRLVMKPASKPKTITLAQARKAVRSVANAAR